MSIWVTDEPLVGGRGSRLMSVSPRSLLHVRTTIQTFVQTGRGHYILSGLSVFLMPGQQSQSYQECLLNHC